MSITIKWNRLNSFYVILRLFKLYCWRLYIVKCIRQRFGAECLEDLRKSDNEEIRKLIDLPELKPIQVWVFVPISV